MNKEAEVGLIVPRITQYFLAIFEYIPFAVRIPFAVPPPVWLSFPVEISASHKYIKT